MRFHRDHLVSNNAIVNNIEPMKSVKSSGRLSMKFLKQGKPLVLSKTKIQWPEG